MTEREQKLERLRQVEKQLAEEAKKNGEMMKKRREEMGLEPLVSQAELDNMFNEWDKETPKDMVKKLQEIEVQLESQVKHQEELLAQHNEKEAKEAGEDEDPDPASRGEIGMMKMQTNAAGRACQVQDRGKVMGMGLLLLAGLLAVSVLLGGFAREKAREELQKYQPVSTVHETQ